MSLTSRSAAWSKPGYLNLVLDDYPFTISGVWGMDRSSAGTC